MVAKRLKQLGFQFLREEEGQSTVEYILILAVVVLVAMKFKNVLKNEILEGLLGKLEDGIGKFGQGL